MDRSVVLAALVALLIYPVILVIQAWMRRRKFIELVERLPGPKAKPLVGNTMDFRVPREEVFKVFAKRIKENGPLFRVWAGPIPVVIIRKAEYLETIMSSSKYIDKSYGYKFLHPWLGLGLLTSSGSKWLNRRKSPNSSVPFWHSRRLFRQHPSAGSNSCQTVEEACSGR
ncbi:cytochrome P450 4C1-like [Ctenocephalides felis]|uniref:cytochrome P450 4C1-like n=1 Tax=Ctenocephalides felis TaxID=7515 RepID=UPI000E6E1ACB|nr:cytochrome P450 4C1-like [Ctenocephalides felis]